MGRILSVPVWAQNARNLQDFSWNQISRSLEKLLKIRAHKKTPGKTASKKVKFYQKPEEVSNDVVFFVKLFKRRNKQQKERLKKRNIKGALDRILPLKMLNGKTSQQKERFQQKTRKCSINCFSFWIRLWIGKSSEHRGRFYGWAAF